MQFKYTFALIIVMTALFELSHGCWCNKSGRLCGEKLDDCRPNVKLNFD
jgi:hypothetical protein